jgi:hypothetical protein
MASDRILFEGKLNLYDHAYSVYSQFGQDGITLALVDLIKPNKYFVEFGSSGTDTGRGNTPILRTQGWDGLLMDQEHNENQMYPIHKHTICAGNINDLFCKYNVPTNLGFLSIDIDGQDYWVWKALEWNADIVLVEANHTLGHMKRLTVPENPDFKWTESNFYGASRRAFLELGQAKGYSCVAICVSDMFFVKDEHLTHGFDNVNDLDKLDVAKTWLWVPEWERKQTDEQPWIKV